MRVLQISGAFYPASQWWGPTYSVHSLCNAIAGIPGIELRVLTTDSDGPKLNDRIAVDSFPKHFPAGYDVYYCRRWWGACFSPGMILRMMPMIKCADVVHLTAVYSAPIIPALLICKVLKKPVVWSPRGSLQRWKGSTRTRLKSVWDFVCNLLCDPKRVTLHATSEEEKIDSCERISSAAVAVIPNGVEVSPYDNGRDARSGSALRLLYLGRLHPIKGIENLLRATADLDQSITLSIHGEGKPAYQKSLEALSSELSLGDRVRFHGKSNGKQKALSFRQADVCVVPSFKENFCMVVAEALAQGVPVIASKGTPWRRLEEMGCGIWADNSPEALAHAIRQINSMPLHQMGQRGREWMKREFEWPVIALRMGQVYQRLHSEAAKGKHQVEL